MGLHSDLLQWTMSFLFWYYIVADGQPKFKVNTRNLNLDSAMWLQDLLGSEFRERERENSKSPVLRNRAFPTGIEKNRSRTKVKRPKYKYKKTRWSR